MSDDTSIEARFRVGASLRRVEYAVGSFQHYLRSLPLKKIDSQVKLYDGSEKIGYQTVFCSVVDLPIGKKDLHQCADAIMHLKSRYHYEKQEYDSIGFHFVNGFYCDYNHWKKGFRTSSDKTKWEKRKEPSTTEQSFWAYLETVFMFAGTASLAKELKPIDVNNLQCGGVFILGGSPGHAVIVFDLATNTITNEKYFLLAQSYMPAQEIQILVNNTDEEISPWISLSSAKHILSTPEWTFYAEHLKRF